MKHQFFSINKGGNDIKEFNLNNVVYRETIFQGYYITKDGEIAQIKFDEFGKLKSFFLMRQEITKDGYSRVEINHKHYFKSDFIFTGEENHAAEILDEYSENKIDLSDINRILSYIMLKSF